MYDTDGTYLGRVGKPIEDGRRCRYPVEKQNGPYGKDTTYAEQPIGEPFHTDADRSRVCTDEAMKHCFLVPPKGRGTLAVEGSERFAKRYDKQEKTGELFKDSKKARKAAARAARAEEAVAEQTVPAVGSAMPLPTSRAARRESLRQAGIPTSQQPTKLKKTPAGYQYQYQVHDAQGKPRIGIVTDQTTDRVVGHGPHWDD